MIPRRPARIGIEGASPADASPDPSVFAADDGDAHDPASFHELAAGTALFGDGDFSGDDGGGPPLVA